MTPARAALLWTLGAGVALGSTGLAVDELSGPVGAGVRVVLGGAVAWGLAALVTGHLSPDRRTGVRHAVVLLVAATLTYYGLIVAIGHRWRGAVLADGTSAFWPSLVSVGRATAIWLAVAIVAGMVMGWLGATIRSSQGPTRAVAAGLATGLLGAPAVDLAIRVPLVSGPGVAAAVCLGLAVAVPAGLLRRGPWLVYLGTGLVTVLVATAGWGLVGALV